MTLIDKFLAKFYESIEGVRTENQILQDSFIDNTSCPICNNDQFEISKLSPKHGGGGSLSIATYSSKRKFNVKCRCCTRCGYIMLFKDSV